MQVHHPANYFKMGISIEGTHDINVIIFYNIINAIFLEELMVNL